MVGADLDAGLVFNPMTTSLYCDGHVRTSFYDNSELSELSVISAMNIRWWRRTGTRVWKKHGHDDEAKSDDESVDMTAMNEKVNAEKETVSVQFPAGGSVNESFSFPQNWACAASNKSPWTLAAHQS
ncbi:hypothetical protein Z517_09251 [Fonsecaea pedrosoi CBS 271.37]|uniref:Uncharacterized protein n=1 Tax=Fonsecaea pedrosoi CBS 271.37 TaxID=1442368 RepID=A0A0D2ERC2_9EURO|nr:uncharacterized protein Z517_09251 [Fonsecaea pedrosoi CBS 271.37]KIW76807.1 hypothetical protein Z517_09251 [Fonsecaea pedrosoi CBS 271.37]